jgi:hypothetical protein
MAVDYKQYGETGIDAYSGFVNQAATAVLTWPTCYPAYNRIYRQFPPVTIMRTVWENWAGAMSFDVTLPDNKNGRELGKPTDKDKEAQDFYYSVLDDMGQPNNWLKKAMSTIPLFGWGMWEVPYALRQKGWRPPDKSDPWRSQYDDGLVGFRGVQWRDYSSFQQWEMELNGRVTGLVQQLPNGGQSKIPLAHCLHLKYGDMDSPEGLATLETIYGLEWAWRGYQNILQIGSEHGAGHVVASVTGTNGQLSDDDKAIVAKVARAISSAQQGNYVTETDNVKFRIEDVPFSAAGVLLEIINKIEIQSLQTLGMQWVSMATSSGSGSYAALSDSSEMSLLIANGAATSSVDQWNAQLTKRLFQDIPQNAAHFAGMTRQPMLVVKPLTKQIPLNEVATFVSAMAAIPTMPLGKEDIISIRANSGGVLSPEPPDDMEDLPDQVADTNQDMPTDEPAAEMATAVRFVPSGSKRTIDVTKFADSIESYAEKAADKLIAYAQANNLQLLGMAMEAEPVEEWEK